MRLRLHLILYILSALPLTVSTAYGQDNTSRQIYNQAEVEYDIGQLDQAITTLRNGMSSFEGTIRQSAYRLMALCWLALDEPGKAREWTRKLLNDDPYYTSSAQDPQRFAEMITEMRSGLTAKITTASSQAESLNEVPVPTTLITEEMIHNSGARNLQEVLAAYVPGMNIVDCNDDINIAMRGIYSNGQEKILIMLNGHRLNSYCTNIASPDFSISLEKIKQIEVLRGPASSIYGGVALTGVVNLITKQGADVDGVMIKGGIGNYGQLRGDMIFGKRYFDLDLLVWGSIYKASGEERELSQEEMEQDIYDMPENTITIGRIGNKPSYDFGIQLKWKNMQFLYDTQFSQIIAPYAMTTLSRSYAHDKYKTFNGHSPSFATQSHHANLSYSRQFGELYLKGTLIYDNSDLTHYQVLSDSPMPELGSALGFSEDNPINIFNNPGLYRYINGQEQEYGAQLKGDFSYINSNQHKGSVAFGAEFSHFELDDVRYILGYNFNEALAENDLIADRGKGHENSYNTFVQLKHQWRSLIFNAGLRYDHKKRTDNYTVNELSPRVALILLQPKWNLKMSFSKSFVDAPYLYRKTNELLPILTGENTVTDDSDATLLPESVNSFQLTFAGIEWVKGLSFEVNGFYNHANNMITTHVIRHVNEGENKTAGVELMAVYRNRKLTANLNLTWTRTFEANMYIKDIDANNNTPSFMSHAVVSWRATPRLKLFSHIELEGKQTSYNLDVVQLIHYEQLFKMYTDAYMDNRFEEAVEWKEMAEERLNYLIFQKEIDAHMILNIGAEYNLGKVTLGLNVRNLFNTNYNRSGMNTKLIPQRGRWYMINVAYKI